MIEHSNDEANIRAASAMSTIPVSSELLEGVLEALNDLRNVQLRSGKWSSTYQLAAELTRVLKSSKRVGRPAE